MVDDVDIAKKAQYAPVVLTPSNVQLINPVEEAAEKFLSVTDAVQLSAHARSMMKDMRDLQGGMTVAEAWLRQKIAPPDLNDPRSLETSAKSNDSNNHDKEQQESLTRSFNQTMNDIGWLLEAIGVRKPETDPIADAIAEKAAQSGVGVVPPLAEQIARAQKTGAVAALFVENVDVTIQRNKVVDVSVDRVTITQVHDTVDNRFSGTDKPLILDVGGEMQQVQVPSAGRGTGGTITPDARPDDNRAAKVAEMLLDNVERPEDPRRALLIVREGGKMQPEGTVRVKLDALMPLR